MKNILRRCWHIFRAQSFEKMSENAFATHLPVLVGISRIIEIRRILEFGSGINSTLAFMNREIFPKVEKIVSYENNREWFEIIKNKTSYDKRVELFYYDGKINECVAKESIKNYDLIFVDDSTKVGDRAKTIKEVLKQEPNLLMIHDFETFSFRLMVARFGKAYRFKALLPNVGVFGNISLVKLKKINAIISENKKFIPPEDLHSWSKKFLKL